MDFSTEKMTFTRPPKNYEITKDGVKIVTEPFTDLWQRTYYRFRNDSAPVLLFTSSEQFFSFEFKTEFDSKTRFDQSGVIVYQSSESWIKASLEYENDTVQRLGSVVTNFGYSDWASVDVPADIKSAWFRLSRRGEDFCIEHSPDGSDFSQMRICHLHGASESVSFGVYACSPENSSFTAAFSNLRLTQCKWAPHDGQQPDDL